MYAIFYLRNRNKGFVGTPLLDEIYSIKQKAAQHDKSIKVLYLSRKECDDLTAEIKAVETKCILHPLESEKIKTSKQTLDFLTNLFTDMDHIAKFVGVPIEIEVGLDEKEPMHSKDLIDKVA